MTCQASDQNKFVDPREDRAMRLLLRYCLLLTRAVRRMHAAGLSHSDLSYKNVLIDPEMGHACIIDVDGLVVPGKYPPDIMGTPDLSLPEVVKTSHLSKEDPNRVLPSISTDRHALSVLIYMYLFFRFIRYVAEKFMTCRMKYVMRPYLWVEGTLH